jgi:hypothetical protein
MRKVAPTQDVLGTRVANTASAPPDYSSSDRSRSTDVTANPVEITAMDRKI